MAASADGAFLPGTGPDFVAGSGNFSEYPDQLAAGIIRLRTRRKAKCFTIGTGDHSRRMTTTLAQSETRIPNETRILVQAAAAACEDKKGQDTRILELDPVDSGLADFFLITSASNDRQAVAISDEIELRLKREYGVYANSVEGRRQGEWVLLDYVDFVVHVFLAERRAFYDIERLRKSARPLTPAEFDEELKAALREKTRAVRGEAAAKRSSAAKKSSSAGNAAKNESGAVKKTVVKKTAAKKTVVKKTAAKKTAKKKSAAKK
jgi:ribosome-associated protein